jgi:hypothetical protein
MLPIFMELNFIRSDSLIQTTRTANLSHYLDQSKRCPYSAFRIVSNIVAVVIRSIYRIGITCSSTIESIEAYDCHYFGLQMQANIAMQAI